MIPVSSVHEAMNRPSEALELAGPVRPMPSILRSTALLNI